MLFVIFPGGGREMLNEGVKSLIYLCLFCSVDLKAIIIRLVRRWVLCVYMFKELMLCDLNPTACRVEILIIVYF